MSTTAKGSAQGLSPATEAESAPAPGAGAVRQPTELALDGVSKRFRRGLEIVHALDEVDLAVDYGEFVSVVGPSGSGKSPLLYLAGGFSRPDSGTVRLAGTDLSTCSGRQLAKLRRT